MKLHDVKKMTFDSRLVIGWWDGPCDPSEDILWDEREREEAIPECLLEADVMTIEAWSEQVLFVAVEGDILLEDIEG